MKYLKNIDFSIFKHINETFLKKGIIFKEKKNTILSEFMSPFEIFKDII